jgi:excisionase family DNA binding protein
MSDRETVTVRDAASMLGVSLQQVYKLVWDSRLSGKKVDGKWRITKATVRNRLDKKASATKSREGAR